MSVDWSMEETSDWHLERYRLGELPPDEAEAVRKALARDDALRSRLAGLVQSDAEILARYPSRTQAAAIRARFEGEVEAARPGQWRLVPRALAAAAAVVVTVTLGLIGRTPLAPTGGTSEDGTRLKGLAPSLMLHRKAGAAEVEPLRPGGAARAGHIIQIAYQAAGRRYGVIVSIDGRGVVTRHLPREGAQAAALKAGAATALDEAYVLDDAPGFERFHFVAGDRPFAVEAVIDAVRATSAQGRLDLPASLDQVQFLLGKEGTR